MKKVYGCTYRALFGIYLGCAPVRVLEGVENMWVVFKYLPRRFKLSSEAQSKACYQICHNMLLQYYASQIYSSG
jgi:hypothetical protein